MSRYTGTSIDTRKVDVILNLTYEGYSRPDIAKETGCSKSTVYNYQKRLGLI
jgi:transposase